MSVQKGERNTVKKRTKNDGDIVRAEVESTIKSLLFPRLSALISWRKETNLVGYASGINLSLDMRKKMK